LANCLKIISLALERAYGAVRSNATPDIYDTSPILSDEPLGLYLLIKFNWILLTSKLPPERYFHAYNPRILVHKERLIYRPVVRGGKLSCSLSS